MASTFRRLLDKIQQRKLFFLAPQIEEFKLALKWPANAKIVILPTNNPMIDNIINRQFPQYGVVNARELSDQAQGDQSQAIAEKLYSVSHYQIGALLYGYPNTSEEAHDLDLLLDGVNLAVQLRISDRLQSKISGTYQKCVSCGQVFNSQLPFMTPTEPGFDLDCLTTSKCQFTETVVDQTVGDQQVANYYNEKGLLYGLEIDEEHLSLNQQEFQQRLGNALIHAIKL